MSYFTLVSCKSGLCMNYGLTTTITWCPREYWRTVLFEKRGIFKNYIDVCCLWEMETFTLTILFNVCVSGACVTNNTACPRRPSFTVKYCIFALFARGHQPLLCSKQKLCSSNLCKPVAPVVPVKWAELEDIGTVLKPLDCPLDLSWMEFFSAAVPDHASCISEEVCTVDVKWWWGNQSFWCYGF